MSDIPPLKLKVGKRYVMRNGQVTPPMTASKNGTSYTFGCWIQEPEYPDGDLSHLDWLETGEKLAPGCEHRQDLVRVYDE